MKLHLQAQFPHLILENGCIKEEIYHAIRNAILDGRLRAGAKLPSSRAFAEMTAVSRNSVIAGFERLIDEGYLYTKKGSGTYVSTTIPDELVRTTFIRHPFNLFSNPVLKLNPSINHLTVSWHSSRTNTHKKQMFNVGVGCVDHFPHDLWGRLLGRVWRKSKHDITHYSHPSGYSPLKGILVDYVLATRGIQCHANQIIIVNGTQQAINLTSKVLLQQDDVVWFDDPGYDNARAIFAIADAKIAPISSDEEGMNIAYGATHYPNAKLIYTAPSHQFPLGTTLSLSRRLALLEWARQNDAWVFEDDYNSEFRYLSKPIQALQALDNCQRVIYAGTFSKMMYPGFRLGFLIVPNILVEAFTVMKYYSDSCSSYLEQAALALFIQEGHYARHVRKIRKVCYARQNALFNAVNLYLSHVFNMEKTDSGIHAVCWLKPEYELEKVLIECRKLGFNVQPLSRYCINPYHKNAVLLGYAAHTEDEITQSIITLSHVLNCT